MIVLSVAATRVIAIGAALSLFGVAGCLAPQRARGVETPSLMDRADAQPRAEADAGPEIEQTSPPEEEAPASEPGDGFERVSPEVPAIEPEVPETWVDREEAPGEELDPAEREQLDAEPPTITEERAMEERELLEDHPPEFDIPIVVNDQVLRWVDFYTRRHRDSFAVGLARSGQYTEMFREIFAEAGIPQDLVYMAHVESAYKTNAYSRAHAKGIFQFISATGRRYGLRIDGLVDERSDPEKSARAATRYLRDLYDEFGDWYLALAAYNTGEGRVRRGLRKTGGGDFWKLSRRRLLLRETRNYVPAILAATMISKEPEKYGFSIDYAPPLRYDTIVVEDAVDLRVLAKCAGTDLEEMRRLNPALRRLQTPPRAETDVRVPVGRAAATLTALAAVPSDERILYAYHRVRRGDTLGAIARRHRVSVGSIQGANGMGRSTLIRVGRVLKIPTSTAATYASAAPPLASGGAYRVRRGDTLSGIAKRYGTTARAIARASGISVRRTLHPGDRLVVPGHSGGNATASTAKNTAPSNAQTAASGSASAHVVRRGDTLSGIAKRYGVSASSIARANGISMRKTLYPGDRLVIAGGSAASAPATTVHVVRRGDTLSGIAKRYGTSAKAIARASGISVRKMLHPGDRLQVPGTGDRAISYRVRRGDTLSGIAKRYGTSATAIARASGISLRKTLRPGERLTIPAS